VATVTLQDVAVLSTATNDDVNTNNGLIEAALNGPTIGGTGVEQVNLGPGTPVVQASSVAGLGPTRAGKMGLLKMGSGLFDFLAVVFDATLNKWVSEPIGHLAQQEQASTASATYVQASRDQLPMLALPDFKVHYDAGLRLQVHVNGLLDNSGANDTFLRASLVGFSSGDTVLTASFENGGEIVNNGTTGRYKTSGWVAMSAGAPTKDHAYLIAEVKRTAGTGTIDDAAILARWVSA
jgi:hypothetical protein